MKLTTLAAAIALATASALAQPAPPATDTPPDGLYQQLGGEAGLTRLVDDFMARLQVDARLRPFFKDVNQAHVKHELVIQFCELAGGPCKRRGPDMKLVHQDFDIDRASFNALVEVLQQAMDAQGIGFRTQNRLLAKLAPLHRDIVSAK